MLVPPIMILGGLGLLFGGGLYFFSRLFHVEQDPRLEEILSALPGANCGACGFPGCSGLASALLEGKAEASACLVGGEEVALRIAKILGVEVKVREKQVAVLRCRGSVVERRFDYTGIRTCMAAHALAGGDLACPWGCLRYGDCVLACPFGAIKMIGGFPWVDEAKCTGCGNCVKACPRGLFILELLQKTVHVLCRSREKAKDVLKVCKVGCIACGKCVEACKFNAIHVNNYIAEIDYEKCTSCGACAKVCPTHAILNFRGERKERGILPSPKRNTKESVLSQTSEGME